MTLTSRFDPAGTAEPDHPLWQRFRQVAGDDAAARKLFARMIADPDRLWRLDRAEADPAGAGAVYVAEAVRLADWSYRDHIKKIDRLTVPDAAAVLFLGTYPGAADAVGEKQEWHERIAVGVSDFADGKAGDLQPALARLLAAWLPARTRPDQAEAGLKVVRDLKLRECLPVLRRLAADDATAPPTRALSALLVGTLGGRGEVPLLRRVAEGKVAAEPHDRVQVIVKGQEVFDRLWADERFGGPKPKPEDWKKAFDEADIRKGTRSVADCAWAAAVHAAGGKPVELGFLWPVTVAGRKVEDITHPGFHGFETPAARAAAYAKAAAWLDEHAANPAALVKRLGADEFAAREAAAKALRALGAKAVPALAAAARDPNPEVARRAADVLGLIRADALAAFAKSFDPAGTADYDHPVWTRYKQVVGDDRSARELFAAIIRDQDRLRLLADAEGDPAGAGGLYQREGKRLYEAYKARLDPPNTGEVDFSALPVPEAAAVVYLGTYPASTGKPDPWWAPHRILTHPTATRRTGTPAGWRTDPAARRLYAAWLAHRDREHVLCDGLERAAAYGLEEVLPFARAVAADRDRPAKVRCAALSVLARLGSKADLPAVEALFADETEVDTFRLSRAVEGPKIDGTASVQARDYAVGMALLLYGQNPADFGFDLARGRWQAVDGKPDLNRYEPFHFGFVNGDDARPAAHRKARAWLAVNAAVAPPRQGKVWDHFKAVVGDDKTAGELFDRIVSDPKTRELLEKAAAGDKDARKLALDRSAELSKLAPGRDPVPLPDILGWVLSQTFPAAAVRNGDPYFVHFFPGHLRDDAPARAYVREMTDGPQAAPARKLVAAWANGQPLGPGGHFGLGLAVQFGIKDALPAARAVLTACAKPDAEGVNRLNLGDALKLVGKFGNGDDLPALAAFADSPLQCMAHIPGDTSRRPIDKQNEPVDGRDVSVLARDLAVAAQVARRGGKPADFGFHWTETDARKLIPWAGKVSDDPFGTDSPIGFARQADRDAAHKKARAWLADRAKEPPPVVEPTAGLLADLDALDKLRRGDGTDFAAVEKRGAELLARYPGRADKGRVYFTLTRVYSNSGIGKAWARVEKYGRLALEYDRDPVRRGEVFSALASAAEVATPADPLAADPLPVKRKRATGIVLEGYKELLPLELPPTAPELPAVEKVGDVDGAGRAAAVERHAAQVEARRKAEFVRDMVRCRDTYVLQLRTLYGREPKADGELKDLVGEGLNDPAAAADLLARVAKAR